MHDSERRQLPSERRIRTAQISLALVSLSALLVARVSPFTYTTDFQQPYLMARALRDGIDPYTRVADLSARYFPVATSRPVFIDGRIDIYGPEIVRDYLSVAATKPDWREVLNRYAVRTILVGRDSALSVLLGTDPQWQRVFQGEVENIFIRTVAPPQG